MNVFTFRAERIFPPQFGWVFLIFLGLLLAGCGREGVKTYRIPKEKTDMTTAAASPHGDMMGAHGDAMATPKIQYKTPEGWQEVPLKGGMRAAQFSEAIEKFMFLRFLFGRSDIISHPEIMAFPSLKRSSDRLGSKSAGTIFSRKDQEY